MDAGELTQLQRRYPDGTTGSAWASEDFPLGEIIYQTYTEEDYDAIWQEYLYADKNYWIMRDLGKPNCSLAHPRSARVAGRIAGVWDTRVRSRVQFLLLHGNFLVFPFPFSPYPELHTTRSQLR